MKGKEKPVQLELVSRKGTELGTSVLFVFFVSFCEKFGLPVPDFGIFALFVSFCEKTVARLTSAWGQFQIGSWSRVV